MSGVTQFCGISMGEALSCLEFPGVKEKPKNSRRFSKKFVLNPLLPVCFFSGIVHRNTGSIGGSTPA